MSDAPEAPTATNDEIYMLLREAQMKAEALYRKVSAIRTRTQPGEPTDREDRALLGEISPGASNWDIFHDLTKLDGALGAIEELLDGPPPIWNGAILTDEEADQLRH